MADEQQQPPEEPRDAADRPPAGTGADETRQMPAAGDETAAGDQTEVMPAVSPGDDTEATPAAGPSRAGDTAVFPSVPSWSGRAGVPRPSAVVGDDGPADEEFPAERRWWMPVVIGLVALALLALLGYGLWLVLREQDNADPATPPLTPAATPTATPTPSSPSPTGTPSAVPTTPTPSAPAPVVLPRLVGLDGATARSILDGLGLTYRLTSRPDPTAPPGTVLETDPVEGSPVREGTQITLVIASSRPSPAPPSPVLPSPVLPSFTPSR